MITVIAILYLLVILCITISVVVKPSHPELANFLTAFGGLAFLILGVVIGVAVFIPKG